MTSIIKDQVKEYIELYQSNNQELKEIILKQIAILNQLTNGDSSPESVNTTRLDTIRANFKVINKSIRNLDIAFKSNSTYIKEFRDVKITAKDQEIITYYILNFGDGIITTKDLTRDLLMNRTLAWNYLERLTEKNIFKKVVTTKPSEYKINPDYLFFLSN